MKIILTLLICTGLLLSFPTSAQRTVPKYEPLQPANQPQIFDFSSEVNTEGSPYHYEETQVFSDQSQTEENSEAATGDTESISPDSPIVVEEPPTSQYWILLIIGLLGLAGAIIWAYFRFWKRPAAIE